uniref:Phorbol-ester/DAG-type domain-containing protein n=1 Tax=Quercus lobata TaxID=97700 RepID=A0A7N2LFY6_QUELO
MSQIRKSHFSQIEALDYNLREPRAKGEAKIQDLDLSSHFLLLRDIRNDETVICDVCEESLMDNTYRCKDCNFNVDVLCAKLQPVIRLSIHPNHPLTLLQLSETQTEFHFFCDFCNNRCHSDKRQTFRCKRCKFKIDLDCARMLLNSKHIQHISHEHWLIVKWVKGKDRKYCAACREVCDGETYCCNRCYFFLHKSCAEYPTEIQLYFHSEHPLMLHSGTTKERERCDFCNLICQSLTFRCDLCNFKIHFRCARMLNRYNECDASSKYVRNSTYRHSLFLSNTNMNDVSKHIQNAWIHNHPFSIVYHSHKSTYHGCTACGQYCNGPTYVCFLCRFSLHESCLELLQTVYQNSFHKHPLVIIEKSLYNSASCSACGEPCLGPIYICLTCKFYFHELCLALPQKIQHFSHPCPLTLRQETIKFTCAACEKSHTQFAFHCGKCRFYLDVECALNYYHQHPLILNKKELNHDVIFCFRCSQVISGEIYGCMQCNFYLHRSCAATSQGPQQIKHPFHPNHLLTLCYDSNVWCTASILKSFDEMGEVKYLRHKHFVMQIYKRCAVCEKNSYGPSYNCISCKFFVHRNCLEPAKEVQHPFHLHDLPISVLSKTHIIPKFSCDACHNSCSGFSYQCHECKRGKYFEMDVHCASLKPSINYKDHEHFLTFFEKMDDDPQCEVCKSSYRDASYLRCVKCDFTVHLLCVPLPCTIKHKCHIHPLHLVDYFVEDDSDEYYCDACENIRDPRERVYHCERCGNYVAHVHCVIDKLETGFMPEISAPGFYERNFPLPWKAFRDARWKPVARESAPYSAKGEDVIFVPSFDEGRKSSFRGAKEVSPCPVPVVASPRASSLEKIQSDMKVMVEEGSNKCREPLNAETVSIGKTLQTEAVFTPNRTSVSNEENINSEILLPKSISFAELFVIQIREINEALIKFGKQTDGEIKAKEASNVEITPQNQCDEAKEGSGALEVGLVQARGQLQGYCRVHAQSVQ